MWIKEFFGFSPNNPNRDPNEYRFGEFIKDRFEAEEMSTLRKDPLLMKRAENTFQEVDRLLRKDVTDRGDEIEAYVDFLLKVSPVYYNTLIANIGIGFKSQVYAMLKRDEDEERHINYLIEETRHKISFMLSNLILKTYFAESQYDEDEIGGKLSMGILMGVIESTLSGIAECIRHLIKTYRTTENTRLYWDNYLGNIIRISDEILNIYLYHNDEAIFDDTTADNIVDLCQTVVCGLVDVSRDPLGIYYEDIDLEEVDK
jgi:hypothetical protein